MYTLLPRLKRIAIPPIHQPHPLILSCRKVRPTRIIRHVIRHIISPRPTRTRILPIITRIGRGTSRRIIHQVAIAVTPALKRMHQPQPVANLVSSRRPLLSRHDRIGADVAPVQVELV
jgi:hypothetical protein